LKALKKIPMSTTNISTPVMTKKIGVVKAEMQDRDIVSVHRHTYRQWKAIKLKKLEERCQYLKKYLDTNDIAIWKSYFLALTVLNETITEINGYREYTDWLSQEAHCH
tara:strand:+ start:210 stop:533 length:324 start_codon:yes stop_codon:yes gene_type:complete